MGTPHSSRLPLPLLGISGLGLVLLGLSGIFAEQRRLEGEAQARQEREARAMAGALRGALRDPALWDQLPAESRFSVEGGVLRELVELRETPRPELGWRVRVAQGRLRDARSAEEIEAARQLLARSAELELEAREEAALALRAVWFGERHGFVELRAEWLERMLAREKELFELDVEDRDLALWLMVRQGRRLPDWTAEHLLRLPAIRGEALIELLGELGGELGGENPPSALDDARANADSVTTQAADELREQWAELRAAVERRRRLERAQRATPIWAAARTPLLLSLQDPEMPRHELLYWPEQARGALLPETELIARLRELHEAGTTELGAAFARAKWDGELLAREARASAGEFAVTGQFAWKPDAESAPVQLPIWTALLALGLAGAFGFGLFAFVRGLRRERETLEMRGRFLQTVTHELRTPLASIRMFSEMLRDGRVASEQKREQYHALLASESERLSALVSNVLDSSRLEEGRRVFDKQRLELRVLLAEFSAMLAPYCEREGMRFEIVEQASLPVDAAIHADRDALVQVLWNLCDNGIRYAHEGGELRLVVRSGADRVELELSDLGPGIPPEERERVFEPFQRGKAEQHGSSPGLGLGLHLARSLIRAQGGELRAVEAERGACLRITLPLREKSLHEKPLREKSLHEKPLREKSRHEKPPPGQSQRTSPPSPNDTDGDSPA
jgi:signal transduction histidine kinase